MIVRLAKKLVSFQRLACFGSQDQKTKSHRRDKETLRQRGGGGGGDREREVLDFNVRQSHMVT